jgi:hypothetical protein
MADHPDAELRREAERLGLVAMLELDRAAFVDAMAAAEALRAALRRSTSVFEEPLHGVRATHGEAGTANE